ncbi:hypothetical protein HOD08_03085, partial [bacterium]|nr:hypothetical protein [bacterium]
TILNLANNLLETLPQSLENLVELRSIILDGNPLDRPAPLPHLENLPKMEIITGDGDALTRLWNQCEEEKLPRLRKLLETNIVKTGEAQS